MDRPSLASPAWCRRRQEIDRLVETDTRYSQICSALEGKVARAGWDTDVAAARRDLAAYGRSWFRIFRPAYRRAQATFRGVLTDPQPERLQDRLMILGDLIEGQNDLRLLESEAAAQLGSQAFGSCWNGAASDWASLSAICKWESDCRTANTDARFREILSRLPPTADLRAFLREVGGELRTAGVELRNLVGVLKLNLQSAFGVSELADVPLADISARLRQWHDQPESLSRWIAYRLRHDRAVLEGMSQLAVEIHDGRTAASEAVARFEWRTTPS